MGGTFSKLKGQNTATIQKIQKSICLKVAMQGSGMYLLGLERKRRGRAAENRWGGGWGGGGGGGGGGGWGGGGGGGGVLCGGLRSWRWRAWTLTGLIDAAKKKR